MKVVIVEKDGNLYNCQAKTDYIFKCGKCLFGLIAGIERPSEIPNDCRRCGDCGGVSYVRCQLPRHHKGSHLYEKGRLKVTLAVTSDKV